MTPVKTSPSDTIVPEGLHQLFSSLSLSVVLILILDLDLDQTGPCC